MKEINVNRTPTKYGFFLLWSDGFVRTFVKQKDNSVWIITITIPDPDGNATSKYHTYCLAVGKSSNDRQPVIDYYSKLKKVTTVVANKPASDVEKQIRNAL